MRCLRQVLEEDRRPANSRVCATVTQTLSGETAGADSSGVAGVDGELRAIVELEIIASLNNDRASACSGTQQPHR